MFILCEGVGGKKKHSGMEHSGRKVNKGIVSGVFQASLSSEGGTAPWFEMGERWIEVEGGDVGLRA